MSENQPEIGHEFFMAEAIKEALKADQMNEVPVGAVVVIDNEIVGRGFNQPISSNDPTAHAEVMALRDAAKNLNNYRIVNADMYVTIEPCTMCCGAIVHSRINRLIYGAAEPKAGVVRSQGEIFKQPYFNHIVEVVPNILAEECSRVMQAFLSVAEMRKNR